MADIQTEFIDVSRLRIGHFVFIDLGWVSHPFPLNSFKIQSLEQIETIRALGVERIRYCPERSDPDPAAIADAAVAMAKASASAVEVGVEARAKQRRRELLAEQRASLSACERQFNDTARVFRQVAESAHAQPAAACEAARAVVDGVIGELVGDREACIRLLSERVGERASLHAVNVTVVSLLLARACGLDVAEMRAVGVGALLHDVGKIDLPDRVRFRNEPLNAVEQRIYCEHVAHGVAIGRKMDLGKGALQVIGQHHEHADGSGYPKRIAGDAISPAARIVGLVNRYDNLCNPGNPALAATPHEALSQIFAQNRSRFDATTLGIFIRMMGVYPPGSVVQLSDERHALVVSVNSARPLKPRVIVHDASIPREEALVVDLEDHPELGIRRSLRPAQLPAATIDYLSPRTRICYFFEHASGSGDEGERHD